MKRKLQFEVVPESEYTDFSDREKSSVSNGALLGAGIAATASLSTYAITKIINTTPTTATVLPSTLSTPPPVIETIIEPLNVLTHAPTMPVYLNASTSEMIPTGFIAQTSLDLLANILDPVVQILVAISFPIASVIMIGSCFYFMFGQSEKAWTAIMNAGLGYVLIQMSPLFLTILREVGKSI